MVASNFLAENKQVTGRYMRTFHKCYNVVEYIAHLYTISNGRLFHKRIAAGNKLIF